MWPTIRILTWQLCLWWLANAIGSLAQQTCSQEFLVTGYLGSSDAQGVFVSENYPHSLPQGSSCTYIFRIYAGTAFCIRFDELDLFTDPVESVDETRIEVRVESDFAALLEYSGNGSLFREQPDKLIITRPQHLLNGPLCFKTPYYKTTWTLRVNNNRFRRPASNGVRRFLARYEKATLSTLQRLGNNSSLGLHRCLDGSFINISKRCNYYPDCKQGNPYPSDFFVQLCSDESYEHARCSNALSFGTSFSSGWMSGNRILSSIASIECNGDGDHTRIYYPVSDQRDCGVAVQQSANWSTRPVLRLSGVSPNLKYTCFRLYWKSSSLNSLIIASVKDGRAVLRLDGHPSFSWHMVEWEADSGLQTGEFNVYSILTDKRGSIGWNWKHWLDDLSTEPVPCGQSVYERRMPAVCSFEWSTCGWKTDLPRISDTSISRDKSVAFQDHTSELIPERILPPKPQQVLQMRAEADRWSGSFESMREIPYGSQFCFGFWFYPLGLNGRSVRLDADIEMIVSGEAKYFKMMATAPNNRWNRLMAELSPRQPGVPSVTVSLVARNRSEVQLVLLDDFSIFSDGCRVEEKANNGTVICGNQEWLCANRIECIPIRKVCDGYYDCLDLSDEAVCTVAPIRPQSLNDESWLLTVLQVLLGMAVVLCALAVLGAFFRRRCRYWRNTRRQPQPPRTVTNGRLPGPIRSDRLLNRAQPFLDRPPSYHEVTRAGVINASFTEDDLASLPKYEDAVATVVAATATTTTPVENDGTI